jgi:hypothetical protein
MARFSTWLAGLGIAGLLALAVACGGDDDGGGGGGGNTLNESQAKQAADRFLLTTFGLFTGDSTPKAFIEQFAPECRDGIKESDLATAMLFIQAFAPELKDLKIEEFDVGEVKVEQTDEGYLVSPTDADKIRVKVDGKFVNANTFFQENGFEDLASDDPTEDPILLVRRDGKTYVGDCEALGDFSLE